jgi:hypothetical protein
MFGLFSEINNIGNKNVFTLPANMETTFAAYTDDPLQPARVYNWHKTIAEYIETDLGHDEHLLVTSYAGLNADLAHGDSSYYIHEIDVVSYNNYSDLTQKYHLYPKATNDLHNTYQKPVLWTETGPIEPNVCDDGATWRKGVWMNAFSGVAGFNYWYGTQPIYHDRWDDYATVHNYIFDNPDVRDMFMGDWYADYFGDQGFFIYPACNCKIHNPSFEKEMVYIRSSYTNQFGEPDEGICGVVSNMTDNYYTNWDLVDDSSHCAQIAPIVPQQEKTNLASTTLQLRIIEGSFSGPSFSIDTFRWFDTNGDYIETITHQAGNVPFVNHPESCIAVGCNTTNNTPEIPFIMSWESLFKSVENSESSISEKTPRKGMGNAQDAIETSMTLDVFPNPSKGELNIICYDTSIIKYMIIDSRGVQISEILTADRGNVLDFPNLDTGLYVILAIDVDNAIKYQGRWVKL